MYSILVHKDSTTTTNRTVDSEKQIDIDMNNESLLRNGLYKYLIRELLSFTEVAVVLLTKCIVNIWSQITLYLLLYHYKRHLVAT